MATIRYPLSFATLCCSLTAQAVEVAPGDYDQFPTNATIGLLYYQHARTGKLYANGHKASSDFDVRSDVSLLRLLHVYALTDRLTVDPQFLLPIGRVAGHGAAASLGDSDGIGDLILAPAFKYRLNDDRDILAFTPYLYVPTGDYDKRNGLNLGEHRWKLDLQSAYVKRFSEQWAVDVVGDAIWYGDNNDYGADSVRREQQASYSAQLMARYMPTSLTTFGVGVGHNWGGETAVDGVHQDDDIRTTYLRVSATTFVSPRDQLQLQLGRDVAVENGPREDLRVNLRYAHVF
ncbi:transporter [Pseudomonas syringae group genomosp. 3]|nr:transporter [Pseudomonas syringae group genomosp. 3]